MIDILEFFRFIEETKSPKPHIVLQLYKTYQVLRIFSTFVYLL